MHIHILGICGTFMGSLAIIARELGYRVTGSDAGVYPPMSTQLEAQGITLMEGYDPSHLQPAPDLVVVGNAMSRGNPAIEYMLDAGIPYTSGPQWLADHVLQGRWVLAVAGTHGKTTTTSMLAWILEHAGLNPGFLIGGVPKDFPASARLGSTPFFVVEADEYDSAFFDKRSKFVHYRPRTAILNNLEFDHADIFEDVGAIQKQFHHLVRTIPSNGCIIRPLADEYLDGVLARGCWTPLETVSIGAGGTWQAQLESDDGSVFAVTVDDKKAGVVRWSQTGRHSVNNALVALAAARHAGVAPATGIEALCRFGGVKRRMELLGSICGVNVYDDFAHHPTAIETTLAGLRKKVGTEKILAIIEPRSNTMRMGAHRDNLPASVRDADTVIWYQPSQVNWELQPVADACPCAASVERSIDAIIAKVKADTTSPLHVVIMSNGGFENIHQRLLQALA